MRCLRIAFLQQLPHGLRVYRQGMLFQCLKPCSECEHLVATDELETESGLCQDCAGAEDTDDHAMPEAPEANSETGAGDQEELKDEPIEAATEEPCTSLPLETQTYDANRLDSESLAAACP